MHLQPYRRDTKPCFGKAHSDSGAVDLRKVVRFTLGTIRGIGDPDTYIKPEQPQSSIPPAKINISLSMPFDKLPEDVQNQILPMLGLQPSEELKHEANMKAVGKLCLAVGSLFLFGLVIWAARHWGGK